MIQWWYQSQTAVSGEKIKKANEIKKKLILSLLVVVMAANILIMNGCDILDKNARLEGNSDKYALEKVTVNEDSSLSGYNILYLGSSVTNGSASMGVSFAEYIAKRNNTDYVKEAVNGTTLVAGKNSYIERLQKVDKEKNFDLFICQLSTNDATQGKPLGTPSLTKNPDVNTVCGAIEFIISYVRDTWDCPVVFYTGSYYESNNYEAMVSALHEIAALYDVGVIDMYTDEEFNAISEEERRLYMADDIHPTRAGYVEWWTPKMEDYLFDYLSR